MKVASPFWFYENLARGVRFNSVEDLRATIERIELNTPEGFGYAMAVAVTLLYIDSTTFGWFLRKFQEMVSGRTNLARVEFEEGKATLYSEAVVGTLVIDASKPPCVNLLYLAVALFGEDAMKYRATRVAIHYTEVLSDKFAVIKDSFLPPKSENSKGQN